MAARGESTGVPALPACRLHLDVLLWAAGVCLGPAWASCVQASMIVAPGYKTQAQLQGQTVVTLDAVVYRLAPTQIEIGPVRVTV